jgi:hypothetical protein
VLRKRLHLEAYKLSNVQVVELSGSIAAPNHYECCFVLLG